MGLKGYRLWVMGQLDSTCSASPGEVRLVLFRHDVVHAALERHGQSLGGGGGLVGQRLELHRGVALQVVYLKGKL
jgi:hypothetical protein